MSAMSAQINNQHGYRTVENDESLARITTPLQDEEEAQILTIYIS
jgi:hypothetical protein